MRAIHFFLFRYPVCSFLCMWRILKVKRSAPTEAPFSHRKRCFWNASRVLSLLIPWLCDTTLRNHVTRLDIYCLAASWHMRIDLAHSVLGQTCVSWPRRATQFIWGLSKSSRTTEPGKNTVSRLLCSYLDLISKQTVVCCDLHPEERKTGKEISVVSHSFLLDNYEIYVRPKWGCGWFLLFLSCFSSTFAPCEF